MTDTPSVPDLWWSASSGIIGRNPSGYYDRVGIVWFDGKIWWNTVKPQELPADAVKLGDVSDLDRLRRDLTATLGLLETERETLEAAENELADLRQHARNVAAQRDAELAAHKRVAAELDALRADIRAIVADPMLDEAMMLDAINARLDSEPGREEPGNGNLWEQIRDNARPVEGRISNDELFGDYSAYRPAVVQETACAGRDASHRASCACEECMPIGMDDA